MYNPSSNSSSSSSQNSLSTATTSTGGGGLMRYGSAPSSLLRNTVDSVSNPTRDFSAFGTQSHLLSPARFFPPEPSSHTQSTSVMPNLNDVVPRTTSNRESDHHHQHQSNHHHQQHHYSGKTNTTIGLQRSSNYGAFDPSSSPSSSSSLVRHSSSPAGFLNQLATAAAADNGFSITKGLGSYNTKGMGDHGGHGISRLSSQLSFTRQETLSRIFEGNEEAAAADSAKGDHNVHRKPNHSYTHNNNTTGFAIGSWDDNNQLMFGGSPNKRGKTISTNLDLMDSQFQFGMPEATLEMAAMENLLHIPQDSVPCKIRAKRGFATHPRSIAERERRTRISGKLKKLQDLVPNMDKQTSYSDMLDLAVQHIKSLQNQLQKLNQELDGCTCGCKNNDAET